MFKRRVKCPFRCVFVVTFFLIVSLVHTPALSDVFPDAEWSLITPPEMAGFSNSKLQQAKAIFDDMASNAFIVVYKGKIVVAWGNIYEKIDVFSVRKSFLSALYGIYVNAGRIKITTDLAALGIDESSSLSDIEKTAKIVDLLRARSGVYHPAAKTSRKQERKRPSRGEYRPGEFWFYNNWDFNVLGSIFENLTGSTVFESFFRDIAVPIGMEDFEVSDGRFQKEYVSRYPAYPFHMSARDMARFGLLFANAGKWRGRQIIPVDWVKESTRTHSITTRRNRRSVGYGYMWWTVRPGRRHFKNWLGDDAFSARGNGGQYIIIAPSLEIVAVHTADWKFTGKKVRRSKVGSLLRAILAAKNNW